MEFHEKLQQLRKREGLTQEELAARIFVSRTAVSKWESGRGYPNLDSLKALAKFFSVTVDELLSGGEVLTIAEEARKEDKKQMRDLVFGLLDLGTAALLFLPFFALRGEDAVQAVSLLRMTGAALYLRLICWFPVMGAAVWGVLLLALQNCVNPLWLRCRTWGSMVFHGVGILLLTVALQPYAAAFLILLLSVKSVILAKSK